MKITETTAPTIRVFQIELSQAELLEIARCLLTSKEDTKHEEVNFDTWNMIDQFILKHIGTTNYAN